MRRSPGGLFVAALALALLPRIASAAPVSGGSAAYDLGSQVLLQLFGETTDAGASFAASYGDVASESPLRDLALRVGRSPRSATFEPLLAAAPGFAQERGQRRTPDLPALLGGRVFQPKGAQFVPAPPRAQDDADAPSDALAIGSYEPPVSEEPGTSPLARDAELPTDLDGDAFVQNTPPAGSTQSTVLVPVSMHVGRLRFEGHVQGSDAQLAQTSLQDDAYGAGADFNLRAGERRVSVDVSSSYEHLMRDDTTAYSPAALSDTSWEIGGNSAPTIPNYADLSKLALGANVAVPVTTALTLNLNFNAQRLLGAYGLPGLVDLDAIDNSYGGNLTFAIPRWSSEISVSARQYHYQDNMLPLNTFSDTRENVNFTVKF